MFKSKIFQVSRNPVRTKNVQKKTYYISVKTKDLQKSKNSENKNIFENEKYKNQVIIILKIKNYSKKNK